MSMADNSALPRSAAGNHSPWLIAVIVSLATFMEVLDTTIANVALRHIAGSLAAGEDEATYILTSYLVSNAIVLTISGWLANVIGRKRYYMFSVALFTVSSVLCAFSTELWMILLFRVMQGIGGGGLAPVEQSIFADSFTPQKRALAFSLYGFTVVTAPAIGPALGGWLTDTYSWHWVFLINLPIGLLSLALTAIFVVDSPALKRDREHRLAKGLKIDYVGFALVALGFGCLQIVLDRFSRDDGFSSNFIMMLSLISGTSLVALMFWEWFTPQPVMNLRLLKSRAFAISNVVMFMFGFIIISTTQLLPQLTQELLHYDATNAGLTLSLGGIVTVIGMPIAGLISNHVIPAKYLIAMAMFGVGVAMIAAGTLDLNASFMDFSKMRASQAMWMPFIFIPLSSVQFTGVPPDKSNDASALVNLMRNLGGSVGVSIVTAQLQWQSQRHQTYLVSHVTPNNGYGYGHSLKGIAALVQQQASILAYLDVFVILGVCALCIVPLAFFLPKVDKGAPAGH